MLAETKEVKKLGEDLEKKKKMKVNGPGRQKCSSGLAAEGTLTSVSRLTAGPNN